MNTPKPSFRLWRADYPFLPKSPGSGRIFYGWVIALVSTIGILFSIPGQTMGFSVFTEVLMENLDLSRVQLSSAYCLGTVASGLTLPALGRLYDFWGGRKMAVISALVTGVILFYLAVTDKFAAFLTTILPESWSVGISLVVIGLGFYLIRASAQGVLTMSARNLIGKWFDARRGLVFAIVGIATSFGFSSAPKFLDMLILRYGAEGAWTILGILTICVMAPLAWFFFRDAPEDCGMEMDGGKVIAAGKENLDMVIHRDFSRSEAVRTYSFWLFALSFSFLSLYSTAYTFHIVSLGEEFGMNKESMISMFVPMAAVGVVTSLFCGVINSRTRLKWLLAGMNCGALLGAIGLLRLSEPGGIALYVIGNGVCGGFFGALSGIVWPRFFGRKHLGAVSGVNMSAMVIASGIGPLAFALSVQITGSFSWALGASVTIPSLLFLGSFFADNPQRKANV